MNILFQNIFFLDVPEEVCQNRLEERDELEIFEKESMQEMILANYRRSLEIFAETDMNIHIIDGTLPPEELGKIIWSKIR